MAYTTQPNKVAIIGGGVAGLTAAHELALRGFSVELYERSSIFGGKSRSVSVPGSAKTGHPLPAEHGFRFFPGFYRHLPDTLAKIPYANNARGVLDNLVPLTYTISARSDGPPISAPVRFPNSFEAFVDYVKEIIRLADLGVPAQEFEFYVGKLWQLWTSSKARITSEYEQIPWWDFIEAENKSEKYKQYLARAMTTQLVASQPQQASTRSIGRTGYRLMFETNKEDRSNDRVLNGPTNKVWIDPWIKQLKSLGVKCFDQHELISIELNKRNTTEVDGLYIKDLKHDLSKHVQADYYILALPVEALAKYIWPELREVDNQFRNIEVLQHMTSWMNGIMLYLNRELDLAPGHISFLDSPWAITAISQAPIWTNFDFRTAASGQVRTCLSVAISDWTKAGLLYNKPALACSPQEILEEVWAQIELGLNSDGKKIISKDMLESWYLDPDIQDVNNNPHKHVNLEPLLVNVVNSWQFRPTTNTKLPNLFLAGDYVKTNSDIACMESANESAKRAVNSILQASGSEASPVPIYDWNRSLLLKPFILYDAWRFKRGLPWASAPFVVKLIYKSLSIMRKVVG